MIMKNYVADELSNKVYHLNKALHEAEQIIATLEEENNNLKKILDEISHSSKEEYLLTTC